MEWAEWSPVVLPDLDDKVSLDKWLGLWAFPNNRKFGKKGSTVVMLDFDSASHSLELPDFGNNIIIIMFQ